MTSTFLEILTFALPTGFLSSIVTWIVSRRKRNNDFLSEMQKSIDLLSEQYNKVLRENVSLQAEKAEWQVTKQELMLQMSELKREVESLRREVKLKSEKDEKILKGRDLVADVMPSVEFVRGATPKLVEGGHAVEAKRESRQFSRRRSRAISKATTPALELADDKLSNTLPQPGGGTTTAGDADDDTREPS